MANFIDNVQLPVNTIITDQSLTDGSENYFIDLIKFPNNILSHLIPSREVSGPTSNWADILYKDDGFKIVSSPINVFSENYRYELQVSLEAIEDIKSMYGKKSFARAIANWAFHKFNQDLKQIFTDQINSISATLPAYKSLLTSEENAEDFALDINAKITTAILDLKSTFILNNAKFGICCPSKYAEFILQYHPDYLIFANDKIQDITVFVANEDMDLGRSLFTLFFRKPIFKHVRDWNTGNVNFFFEFRSDLVVNAINDEEKLIRRIEPYKKP